MSFHVAKKVLVTNSYSTLVTTGYFESQPRKRPQAPALPTRQTAGLHHCRSCELFGLQTLREQPFYTCRMSSLDLWGFLLYIRCCTCRLICPAERASSPKNSASNGTPISSQQPSRVILTPVFQHVALWSWMERLALLCNMNDPHRSSRATPEISSGCVNGCLSSRSRFRACRRPPPARNDRDRCAYMRARGCL